MRSGCLTWVGLVLAGLTVLWVIGTLAGGPGAGEAEPTRAVLPTWTPTSAPATVMPVPPTVDVVSDERAAYAAAVVGPMELMGEGLGRLGTLLSEPDLFNDDWRVQVAGSMAVMMFADESIMEIIPPSSLVAEHGMLVEAFNLCRAMTVPLTEGIDGLSAEKLNLAAEMMGECGEKIGAVNLAFSALIK